MTALTPVVASRAVGANLATALTAATAGGETFPAGPNTFLRVKSTNAGTVTVTVTPPTGGGPLGTTVAPLALAPVVPITTGDIIYGPFPASPFADSSGTVTATCSTTTGVTVGAFIFPSG